jgi:hypothetical protein
MEEKVILQVSLSEANDIEILVNHQSGVSRLTLIGIIEQVKANLLSEPQEVLPPNAKAYDA